MNDRGFTLIETVIYIALLSLLLSGTLLAAYGLLSGADRVNANTTVADEGTFVLRKIEWALSSIKSIDTPLAGTSTTLTVHKTGYARNPITIRWNAARSSVEIAEGAGNALSLTTGNVLVTKLEFKYLSPAGIAATAVIDGATFITTKYIRK